jgi:hypothetical protein
LRHDHQATGAWQGHCRHGLISSAHPPAHTVYYAAPLRRDGRAPPGCCSGCQPCLAPGVGP